MSDNTPDEVEQLADALYGLLINLGYAKPGGTFVRTELRTLARAAAAVGARTALEDVRDELNGLMDSLDDSVIADETERLGVYDAIHAAWLLTDPAAYTTDEETTT